LALLLAAWFPVGATPASAADLRNVLTDHSLTSWGVANGLQSGAVYALAQDQAGYLWLGTDTGLVRFDGVLFMPWEAVGPALLPKASVRALLVSKDGSVWVGFGDAGGVSRVQGSEVWNYGEAEGLSPGVINTIVETPAGTIWAGGRSGLHRLEAGRWTSGESMGLPGAPVFSAFVDARGRLFVATEAGLFARESEGHRFKEVDVPEAPGSQGAYSSLGTNGDAIRAVSVDPKGRLWVTDPMLGFKALDGSRMLSPTGEAGRGMRLLHDSAGNLWVGLGGQGVWRVKHEAPANRLLVEHATALTGLLGNGVNSLLQDREGNIWAGTLDGLNRLTPHRATPLLDLGLVGGVEVTSDAVWVAATDRLWRFTPNVREPENPVRKAFDLAVSAMHTDERGTLWLATPGAMLRMTSSRMSRAFALDADTRGPIELVTSDRAGGVWVYGFERGLSRWTAGRLAAEVLSADLGRRRVTWMDAQRTGELWLAFAEGGVARRLHDGQLQQFDGRDGLSDDVFHAIYEDRDGVIWLGGLRGLTRFRESRFTTLEKANGYPLEGLTGIVGDDSGHLWLGTRDGIVRLNPSEFEQAVAAPDYRMRYRLYAKTEGLAGNPRWYGNRGLARAGDGRLWFVSSRGVTLIDPRVVSEYDPPAPVRIETVVADRQRFEPLKAGTLPPRTKTLEIVYGALALTSSRTIHFRYRLAGFESDWMDVGTRRQASYTNLPPGDYQFQVEAGSQEGTWTEPGAIWSFRIEPVFYQTRWFFGLCLVGLVVSVGGAWRLHVRRVRKEFALLLGERARLSREIHDTLLQGLFGVALRCDAIAGEAAGAAPGIKTALLSLRKDVEGYIREARQSISNLRSPHLERHGLPTALRETAQRAAAGSQVALSFDVDGNPQACPAHVEEQLLRIGQEAVLNAIRHSRADAICVSLAYNGTEVLLRVADDGSGFEPLRSPGNGHYGLTSMKERAEAAGGILTIASAPGDGTEVLARVPYVH
jgi:signal transduction histidine kinase/ligand-binding sensor domain-containing protein